MDLASGNAESSRRVIDWLSVPAHREAVRACIVDVLAEVAPEEVEVVIGYIDPFMDCAARGELVAIDSSEEAGRFGGGDWMLLAVVPLVVTMLGDLLSARHAGRARSTRRPLESREISAMVSPEAVKRVVRAVGSRHARRRIVDLRAALAKGAAKLLASLAAAEP